MVADYDEVADWYDESVRAEGSLAGLVANSLLDLIGDAAGQHVCDLGCGQGLVARHLARGGARVVGIDLSAKLLELARRYQQAEPLGIIYQSADARTLEGVGDERFDGAACNLALMDIDDLLATFQAVRRVLRPAGWFVFSITHPCFQIPPRRADEERLSENEAGDYFAERFWRSDCPHGVRGKVGAYHRTLRTYLNALCGASFILERLIEPRGTGDTSDPLTAGGHAPKFLLVRCRKGEKLEEARACRLTSPQ